MGITKSGFFKELSKVTVPLVMTLLLFIYNRIKDPHFFELHRVGDRLTGSLVDIFNRSAPVAILSLGMTVVIATGGVDLSVGAIIAIAGSLCAYIITTSTTIPVVFAIVISLLVGLFLGIVNGTLVSYFKIQPIVATLVLMVSGRGVAELISQGQMIHLADSNLLIWKHLRFLGLPPGLYFTFATAIFVYVILRRTALGLFVEALGDNEQASKRVGIHVELVKTFAYALSGLCAAIAGIVIMFSSQVADANSAGLYLELDAILSVVIGGTLLTGGKFNLVGSILGAILMQTVTTTILTTGVKPEVNLIVKAVIIIITCILRSDQIREKFRSRELQRV